MQDDFITTQQSVALLYGDTFYLVGDDAVASVTPPTVTAQPPVPQKPEPPASTEPVPPEKPVAAAETTVTEAAQPSRTAGITWRTKPSSKMLFILQQTELKDPILTEFLKKIVEAIGIPFETAGFGIINGPVNLQEFDAMPNRYAVVFDADLWMQPNVASTFGDKEVYFTLRLAFLQNDAESKRELWSYLKNLKEMLQ